jgi:hypothetical protein
MRVYRGREETRGSYNYSNISLLSLPLSLSLSLSPLCVRAETGEGKLTGFWWLIYEF